MDTEKPKRLRRSVSELEVIYSNLSEQIKIYDIPLRPISKMKKKTRIEG